MSEHWEQHLDSVPIVNVIGERVALGPLDRSLLPLLERWDNDFRTADLGGDTPAPVALGPLTAQWESLLRGERADWVGFAIYQWPEVLPIGVANLRDFQNAHGTAEFGITIGEVSARGQGLGTEAVKLLLDYAFSTLGVYNVWLDTAAYNVGAIRAYEKAGFREIGRRRGAHLLAEKRHDIVFMDCTADDWRATKGDK
jgi:RimJ/RimL family protein N-acetyltransferase